MVYKNEALKPTVTQKSMWSLDNPNLVKDVGSWATREPNIYYVGAGLLLFLILLIACIKCCCKCCCNGSKIADQPLEKLPKK